MTMQYSGSMERLRRIMKELREKCPWDKKQTLETLRPQTIEEVYELADALDQEDWDGIKEELGDLLLHIVFYARMSEERNGFSFPDLVRGVSEKLVARHPHIYGKQALRSEEEVRENWEKIKMREGKTSLLSGVPQSMPAMTKARTLQEKTRSVGFEWKHAFEVKAKVDEEWQEVQQAVAQENKEAIEAEMGDMFFALINYARFLGIDPERALEKTNRKFISRFQQMEEMAQENGQQITDLDLAAQDRLWNLAKSKEKPA